MLKACVQNSIKFRYVLADIWYGSAENMNYIAKELKRFLSHPSQNESQSSLIFSRQRKTVFIKQLAT